MPLQLSSSDRAQDPLRGLTRSTVSAYDTYLHDVYEPNADRRRKEHDDHYDCMKDRLGTWLEESVADGNLPSTSETNFAFVGLMSASQELDRAIIGRLQKFRSIVLIDFSTKVLRRAAESLMEKGISGQKLFTMQFDITNGLSTVLDEWIREKLIACPDGEDEFHRLVEDLEHQAVNGTMIGDLMDRFEKKKSEMGGGAASIGSDYLPGGENTDRKLQLSIGGVQLQLHGASYQMVTGATAVPTKDYVLDRFEEQIAERSRSGASFISEADVAARKLTVERIYEVFAAFNTHVTQRTVTQMIDDNGGKTRALLLTDYGTLWTRPKCGEMPQLHIKGPSGLKAGFHQTGKELVETSQVWHWQDQNLDAAPWDFVDEAPLLVSHEHLCQAMEVHQNGRKPTLSLGSAALGQVAQPGAASRSSSAVAGMPLAAEAPNSDRISPPDDRQQMDAVA